MTHSTAARKIKDQANLFAALGDPTRLSLVAKLIDNQLHSISELSNNKEMTRQAVTKHLTVLENVGLVTKIKEGRESLYMIDTAPLKSLQDYLDIIASQWDKSLLQLKLFIEE